MSPTEFDLRSALRDGEGDGPNVDRIVAGAVAQRSQRRARILSTAAAVVVVAGIATGGVELVSHSRDDESAGGAGTTNAAAAPAAAAASSADRAGAGSTSSSAPEPKTASGGSAPSCPTAFPHTLLPGGGSPGQFGASGKLFTKPVRSIVVCRYGGDGSTTGTSTPGRTVIDGSAARAIATSLENAQKRPLSGECPDYIRADAPSVALIAVSTDGTVLPAVTTSLGRPACATQVTNGTVVRYGWSPPASLNPALGSSSAGTSSGGTPVTGTSTSH